jgi:hypothetical protein
MRRADVLHALPVAPDDFVVEIGSGPTPFRRTRLIFDKYPFENHERHGDILNVAPVIKADAIKLPLADKSCDLLFVSHVLEHIEQAERFLQEAKRCAKRVYFEFPTRVRELMYGWSFHKWLIQIEDGKLVFYRNDIPHIFGDFFHRNYDLLFDVWSDDRFAELNYSLHTDTDHLHWEISPKTALEYALEVSAAGAMKVNYRSQYGATGVGNVRYARALLMKLGLWLLTPDRLVAWRRKAQDKLNDQGRRDLTDDVLARLVCQECGSGGLSFEESRTLIRCGNCNARYTQERGVFDFDR